MPVWFELLNFKSQILAISCHGLARLFRVIRRLWRQGQFSVTSSEGPPGLELSSFAPYRSAGDRLRKGAIRSEWSVAIFSRGAYSGRLSFKFNSITRSWLHMSWASNHLKISFKKVIRGDNSVSLPNYDRIQSALIIRYTELLVGSSCGDNSAMTHSRTIIF